MTMIFGLIALGILAGYLSGLVGIGGGIIIVPALMFFLNFAIRDAQGTSLAALIPPVGILAVYDFYKNGNVNVTAAAIIALSFFIGAFLGAKTNHLLRKEVIEKVFACMLLVIALKMLLFPKSE
ncbi:MAG: sulfite exporter TauE/SafE family protein [Bacteroidetes bacterium]|nr:sulfite exporter TauE/SafE family protein [Bacteroidota bacterium]